jgi:hypothetical protein
VVLLLHMDGANNSTTLVDSGPLNYSSSNWTFGNPTLQKISTAQKKFGPSSLYFTPNQGVMGDNQVETPYNVPFSTNTIDYTIEFWSLCISLANDPFAPYLNIVGYCRFLTVGYQDIVAVNDPSGNGVYPKMQWSDASPADNGTILQPLNQWTHIALARQSGTSRLFVNGQLSVQRSNVYPTPNAANAKFQIGTASVYQGANGYIDDFRFTVGVARYTSNFTVPTAPFPDQ